ncbi:arp2/3 complex, 34 kD subunit p34-Arc [Actinidia rufa]|uniref:Arp2/3 complex 34 kDa subunit n=1 Tax=Actinidia rufa TaxID=165716 RepID=A0A7J0DXA9_9ERIC|nr:arp2/3 complex, 34 kD subunit p34-Arc [Actinidia rufa]
MLASRSTVVRGSSSGVRGGGEALVKKYKNTLLVKIASVREVVMGAPLRVVLKHLASRTIAPGIDRLVALVHRPTESFFLVPQAEKVTVIFPMRFKDSIDTVLATSFLQLLAWFKLVSGTTASEVIANILILLRISLHIAPYRDAILDLVMFKEFVEARHTAGLINAPPCSWSSSPPSELKGAPVEASSANAGFVSFVLFPRHVEGKKLDKTVWNFSTFHAYVNYHVKGEISLY